jgi:hypothetical protein
MASRRYYIRAILVWVAITLCWSAFIIALSTRLSHSQQVSCYQIEKSGELCIPSTGEIFVEEAHAFYEKWMQPPKPTVSCCNKQDCEPVEARFDEKRGIYQAYIEGQWVDIPQNIVLDPKKPENASPDGSYHACWNRTTKELLCFREAEPKI